MTSRLATTIGIPFDGERSLPTGDVVRVREPATGAEMRTKGTLLVLAQISLLVPEADAPRAGHAAERACEQLEATYVHDLTGGPELALRRALLAANRVLFQQRQRAGIPGRVRIGLVAVVVHGGLAHATRIGAPSAILLHRGRAFEVTATPPATARRITATSAGEVARPEPIAWHGPLADGDRLALVSRHLARTVGVEPLRDALLRLPVDEVAPALAASFAAAGGTGSDGVVVVEVSHVPVTVAPRELVGVHPVDDGSRPEGAAVLPLVEVVETGVRRAQDARASLRGRAGRAAARVVSAALGMLPRRRPAYPAGIPRTDVARERRRRGLGAAGMAGVASLAVAGALTAGLPAPSPTEAIPRTAVARAAVAEAADLLTAVDRRVEGEDLLDRDPALAETLLLDGLAATAQAEAAGVTAGELVPLRSSLELRLDRLHGVTRIDALEPFGDLRAALEDVGARELAAASDGSLWILDAGRGRLIRVGSDGTPSVVLRAGQATANGEAPGEPWLLATAATDVVVVDRDRAAWRIDLVELVPRRMPLAGIESLDANTTLLAALQHRPPLEIFTLYAVDAATGEMLRWAPPALIPVEFPAQPERWLSRSPDLDPRHARDLRVDVNGWLLHASSVTRVDFGTPRDQDEYSLDPPPDASLRPALDYRHLDAATVGERDLLYVYDAANARILAFGRADGAFVHQWLASPGGEADALLRDVRGISVASVADGPPVAYLLGADRVVRLVLE